jgi:acyl-coenzyme A synthetase/AMP-(fatty) acid ligase
MVRDQKFLYQPDFHNLKNSNISQILEHLNLDNFDQLYQFSISPKTNAKFYVEIINRLNIKYKNSFELNEHNLIDATDPLYPYWLKGAEFNICDSIFNRQDSEIAIKYQSELDNQITQFRCKELEILTNKIANSLKSSGLSKGDLIAISMPMNIEATAIYLAILKIGAVAVCLADSYSSKDIDKRISALKSPIKMIFTQDYSRTEKRYSIYNKLKNCDYLPERLVVNITSQNPEQDVDQPSEGHISLTDFISYSSDNFDSITVSSEDNLAILFSSGTTGDPKAICWKFDSFLKSAIDGHLNFDMQPNKTLCWLTDYGWMMGSFALASSFLNRGTLAIYEGNRGTEKACQFIKNSQINILGIVPAIAENWQKTSILESYKFDNLEVVGSTGNPSNPENYEYLFNAFGQVPIIEYMGGTEISGGYISSTLHKNINPSTFNSFTCGTKIHIFSSPYQDFVKDEIAIIIPKKGEGIPPIGLSRELYNKAFTHHQKYYEDIIIDQDETIYRKHGDLLKILDNGLIKSIGRSDGAININGIKTTIAELERAVSSFQHNIKNLKNFAIFAIQPDIGGEDQMIIFIERKNTKDDFDKDYYLTQTKNAIKQLNPQLAKISDLIEHEIILTASGKKQHKQMKNLYLKN